MKKRPEGKLALGKIKIASLSKNNQEAIKGGMVNPPTKSSKCHSPATTKCTTHYVYCGC
ncbi:MAG: class I lanthipeptide [Ferruginibacter sp.]